MKYDFDHWDKTEMTREEALDWFKSDFEPFDGKRCDPTCPQCQAEEWAIKALSVRWHKYPDEKPEKEGRYLVCYPLSILPTPKPTVDILWWGKSWECEECDKTLKKKKEYWYYSDSEWDDYTRDDIYAWMPLPEPMAMPEEEKTYGNKRSGCNEND